jgi:hypothetical protein
MPEPVKIVFGVLTTYERQGWVHPTILQFFCDLPMRFGFAYRMVPIHNFQPAASGRNVFCRHYKDAETDWICMIDNDMELPDNLLDTLKDAPKDADIVVPAFYSWHQAELKHTLCWGVENEPPMGKFGPGFHELSKCGTGVIFIRPRVFHKISYPYFFYLYNEDAGMQGTEDIQFCLQARKAGVKIYGNASITVGHFHSVELSSMYRWAEMTQKKIDDSKALGVESANTDAECPSAPTAEACPAEA